MVIGKSVFPHEMYAIFRKKEKEGRVIHYSVSIPGYFDYIISYLQIVDTSYFNLSICWLLYTGTKGSFLK
ncbi:MAG: hypothetical protein WCI71_12015 [Bacteroidota bacterium]